MIPARITTPENVVQQIIHLGSHPAMTLLRMAAAAVVDTLRGQTVRRALRHLAAWRTEQALAGLDERTLRDLGLSRSDVGSVSREIAGMATATRRRVGSRSDPRV